MTELAIALICVAGIAHDAFKRYLEAQRTREHQLAAASIAAMKAADKAREAAEAIIPRLAALEDRAEREDQKTVFGG